VTGPPRGAWASLPLLVLSLVVACACGRHNEPREAREPRELRMKSRGAVTALAVTAGKLSFCDEDGLHQFELPSGRGKNGALGACPPGGLAPTAGGPEVTVRTPDHGPDDIVEIAGVADSYPLEGHATDWASDQGPVVIVATASLVLRIDPAAGRRTLLSSAGATRVAVGAGWAAWWDGSAISARPL